MKVKSPHRTCQEISNTLIRNFTNFKFVYDSESKQGMFFIFKDSSLLINVSFNNNLLSIYRDGQPRSESMINISDEKAMLILSSLIKVKKV